MAEIGHLRFARVALEVAEAVLPNYRTKYSKHTFTQPQLLACQPVEIRASPRAKSGRWDRLLGSIVLQSFWQEAPP